MFYKTSHFFDSGQYDKSFIEEALANKPKKWYNVQSLNYQFTDDTITFKIVFENHEDTKIFKKDDLNYLHDGGVIAFMYDLTRNGKIRIVEKFKITQNTKSNWDNYRYECRNIFIPLQIIVPSINDSFLNMDYLIDVPRELEVNSNIKIIQSDKVIRVYDLLPKLKFVDNIPETVSINDTIKFKFNVFWHDELYKIPLRTYVKADQGYVSKQKIITKDGVGEFTFKPLCLDPGDDAEVKIGFKHWSNVLNTKMIITE